MKKEDLKELSSIGATIESIGTLVEGEYKKYSITIDEEYNVIIGEALIGNKPTIEGEILTKDDIVLFGETIDIKITAFVEEGQIASIEAINGALLKEDSSNTDEQKIFTVGKNGEHVFLAITNTGRKAYLTVTIDKFVESGSLLEEIAELDKSGVQTVSVTGKTSSGQVKQEQYSLDVIMYNGDLVLDGITQVEGATLASSTYEFGDKNLDVGTNMVVLKVNGNLTINENVILTACKSDGGYGGPKGMTVYCTGTLINKGKISMTARGAKATGQNVFLYQNNDGSYEYIPAVGASGGASFSISSKGGRTAGRTGNSGSTVGKRATGGGGTGGVRAGYSSASMNGGASAGGSGTSYSGGSGSGAVDTAQTGTAYGGGTTNDGGTGGVGKVRLYSNQWGTRAAGGGTGNPGGYGAYTSASTGNGTAGLSGNNSGYKGYNGTRRIVNNLL